MASLWFESRPSCIRLTKSSESYPKSVNRAQIVWMIWRFCTRHYRSLIAAPGIRTLGAKSMVLARVRIIRPKMQRYSLDRFKNCSSITNVSLDGHTIIGSDLCCHRSETVLIACELPNPHSDRCRESLRSFPRNTESILLRTSPRDKLSSEA